MQTIRFHLANFHEYDGALPVRVTADSEEVLKRTRLTLKFREWAIHIDQDDDIDELQRHLQWYGGYGIGHVGVIERSDGRQFSLAEVYDLLSYLVRFLTFARGLWCAPIVLEGLDGGGMSLGWIGRANRLRRTGRTFTRGFP